MKNISEFQIIGRLGAIKKVGSTTRITIAANYPYKNDSGQWVEDAHWNELVVFSKNIVAYIEKHLNPRRSRPCERKDPPEQVSARRRDGLFRRSHLHRLLAARAGLAKSGRLRRAPGRMTSRKRNGEAMPPRLLRTARPLARRAAFR